MAWLILLSSNSHADVVLPPGCVLEVHTAVTVNASSSKGLVLVT